MKDRGIPVVFIGDTFFLGDEPILNNLEAKIQTLQQCPVEIENASGIFGPFSGFSPNEAPLAAITLAALADSVNPCAMGVLLILLTLLISTGDKKTALTSGIAFIISIYTIYLLFGFGIFKVIQISGLSFWFYKAVGALAVIIGTFSIRDFFISGIAGSAIPQVFRPFLRKVLSGITSPVGAFIAGIFVTLFELPCTGGPYLYVLGMLAEKTTQAAAIPILVYYNIIFILPLAIILSLVLYGLTTVEKAQRWKEKNMKKINLVAGLIMILLGIFVLVK
ncbi:MAG: cytochrome c biogenesis protein CcdA [Candidatus Micrarchaeia archaeon]